MTLLEKMLLEERIHLGNASAIGPAAMVLIRHVEALEAANKALAERVDAIERHKREPHYRECDASGGYGL
jgi:hypothetical protein